MIKWDKRTTQLRDALAMLIPLSGMAMAMLEEANIDFIMINFDGGPLVMWTNILRYCNATESTDHLVDIVLGHFPGNPYLLAFKEQGLQDYSLGPNIRRINWKAGLEPDTKEKITGAKSTLLPISFLETGLRIARAVCRVSVPTENAIELGSGFLIDNNLMITNNHVLPDKERARLATLSFDYELGENRLPRKETTYKLDPDHIFETDIDADFTVVSVNSGDANLKFGSILLKPVNVKKGDFVNIVQHPGGGYKQIGLYHNVVSYANDDIIQYLTDTEPGSSGSPVFNSDWAVVALHHSGGMLVEPGLPYRLLRNEGININKIINLINKLGLNDATQ